MAHLIVSNPIEQIIAPKSSHGAKPILTDEQLDVFMKALAEDEIWYDFFYMRLTTGLRRGEICGLEEQSADCTGVYKEKMRSDFDTQ